MTKPEARRLLVAEASVHKYLGYTQKEFVEKLDNKNKNLEEGAIEAYELIKDEIEHIVSWAWWR